MSISTINAFLIIARFYNVLSIAAYDRLRIRFVRSRIMSFDRCADDRLATARPPLFSDDPINNRAAARFLNARRETFNNQTTLYDNRINREREIDYL